MSIYTGNRPYFPSEEDLKRAIYITTTEPMYIWMRPLNYRSTKRSGSDTTARPLSHLYTTAQLSYWVAAKYTDSVET
jgi:hypothetical protein